MAKLLNVMRGDPVVTPFGACQCFDQWVRFAFSKIHRVLPPLISLTARLLSTCVNCPAYSRLVSSVDPVAAGWLVLPGVKGCQCSAAVIFPISRMLADSWYSSRVPPIFTVAGPRRSTVHAA